MFRPFMAKVCIKLMTILLSHHQITVSISLIKTVAMKGGNVTGENLMLVFKNFPIFL